MELTFGRKIRSCVSLQGSWATEISRIRLDKLQSELQAGSDNRKLCLKTTEKDKGKKCRTKK